jgi:hypothetical protein
MSRLMDFQTLYPLVQVNHKGEHGDKQHGVRQEDHDESFAENYRGIEIHRSLPRKFALAGSFPAMHKV